MGLKKYLIMLVVMLIISCNTGLEPLPDKVSNKILFSSDKSGKPQLYMMNPDGSDIRQLTFGEHSHYGGRWSPDGKKIVCGTSEEWTFGGDNMVVFNIDGSERKLLGYGDQMSWHPSGKKIIFSHRDSHFQGTLFTVNIDSTERTNLPIESKSGFPVFNPQGNKIIYGVRSDVNLNQTVTKIIDYPSFHNKKTLSELFGYPQWSPVGDEIVYVVYGKNINDNIYIMNSNGQNIKQVTNNYKKNMYFYPTWSNDGSKIIFLIKSDSSSELVDLYIVDKNGLNLKKLHSDVSINVCDWSK